jgi:hypothetical protein
MLFEKNVLSTSVIIIMIGLLIKCNYTMVISNVHLPYKGYDMISGFNKDTNEIWVFGGKSNRTSLYHHYNHAIIYSIETGLINNRIINNHPYHYFQYGGFSVQVDNNLYFIISGYLSNITSLYKFDMNNGIYTNNINDNNKFAHYQMTLCNDESQYPDIIFGLIAHSIYQYFGYYNLSNSKWTDASGNTKFTNEHYMGSCVVQNGYLYAIGGTSDIIDKVSVNGIFGNEPIVIETIQVLPDRYNAEASVISYLNYIFIIGGYHNEKNNVIYGNQAISIFDTSNNNIWTYDDAIPIALSKISSVGVYAKEDKMYLFAGYDNHTTYDTIMYANLFYF